MNDVNTLHTIELTVNEWIRIVGIGIEILGVLVIVSGIVWSTSAFLRQASADNSYNLYKTRIGQSLLLGLELFVAADIIKTAALELNYTSLALLAGLVVVRTFLSWGLVLEIEGRWPWQRQPLSPPPVVG
jgi:uncharacterized membrane protein